MPRRCGPAFERLGGKSAASLLEVAVSRAAGGHLDKTRSFEAQEFLEKDWSCQVNQTRFVFFFVSELGTFCFFPIFEYEGSWNH